MCEGRCGDKRFSQTWKRGELGGKRDGEKKKGCEEEDRGEVMRFCESRKLASFRVGLQGLCRQTAFGVEESVWIKQHDSFIAGAPLLG